MKIILNYEEFPLGILSFNCVYEYSSLPTEKEAVEKYYSLQNYKLKDSKNLKSDQLFPVFEDIIKSCYREDIIDLGKFESSDTPFDRLVKIAKLPITKKLYYVTLEKKQE